MPFFLALIFSGYSMSGLVTLQGAVGFMQIIPGTGFKKRSGYIMDTAARQS